MLRRAAFLLLTCWIASDSGAVSAQPGAPDKCSYATILDAIHANQVPDVAGCEFITIYRNLQEAGLRPTREDVPDATVQTGLVSRITTEAPATIFVSIGPPPRPKFTMGTAATVEEGGRLTISVLRQGNDDRSHDIRFITDRTELLTEPISPITFPPSSDEQIFEITTAAGKPGDGDQALRIQLATDEGAEVGDPATVTITDAPAASFAVTASENVQREAAVAFTITRSGPLRPADVEFDFVQDNNLFEPAGMEHPLRFAEGEASKVLTLPANSYSPCRTPTLILRLEPPVQASPTFANPAPDYCRETPPPPPQFPPWWWWIPACVIGIPAAGYIIRKIWPPTPTPPLLYPTWEAELIEPSGETSVPTIPGWPRFAARTEIEWGGTSLPEPLPIAETDHE